ncbi:MAG: phospholipase D-like domain-containing protein [Candidatus Aminicenantales bacterium]
MKTKVRATANNDVIYLWWSVEQKIPSCLGFTIRRVTPDGKETPLPAWVGFEKMKKIVRPKTTDQWPVQGFQWKDVTGPRDVDVKYRIIPLGGTPDNPKPLPGPIIETPIVRMTRQYGPVGVTFNRGLVATQSLNRKLRRQDMSREDLRKCIGIPDNEFRIRLARDLVDAVTFLLKRARSEGGRCLCALYELTDEELIAELESTPGTEIILSNADSTSNKKKVYDGTNQRARNRLSACGNVTIYNRYLNNKKIGQRIGHNKFVVYLDRQDRPQSVVTGSTNWTPTGLCAQTNNSIRIDIPAVAKHFLEYWKKLLDDTQNSDSSQGVDLRTWAGKSAPTGKLNSKSGTATIWFSPNTKRRTKGEETPPDIKELYQAIEDAQKGIFFLLFNPGTPSIVEKIKEVARERRRKHQFLFVRGAISDAPSAGKAAVRIYSRSALTVPDMLITGVHGTPDDFGYWTKELYKLGHAVIHDKSVVIDPFSKNSVVITGSHNLGYKASYMNDENMLIIRGNSKVAEAYATHILDVVNHFRWRYKLQGLYKERRLDEAWSDLAEDDSWQDVYFAKNLLKSRDAFILSEDD